MLGIQMIEILEFIHSQNILHRDLKPANFVMGRTKETEQNVYILDFGLSCQYKNEQNEHIEFTDGFSLIGTARYASINSHLGLT